MGLSFAGIGFWSTNALAGSTALERMPVSVVMLVQFAAATLALGVIRGVQRARAGPSPTAPSRSDRRYSLALGGLGFGGTMFLQYLGFAFAPVVEANIIAYGWPMFAAVWLAIASPDRGTRLGLMLAGTGFVGVGLIITGGAGLQGGGSVLGYAAALGSALCMAFYSLGSGRNRVPALDVMLRGGVLGFAASLVLLLALGDTPQPSWSWLAAAYVGLGPCAAGYLAWSAAMARSGGRLAPLGYATPLLSSLLLLLSGQPLRGAGAVIGASLIVICTVGVVINARVSHPTGALS